MKLILASNNAKKLEELRQLLSDMDVEILSQREAGCDFQVEETGETFEENAYLKARAVTDYTGLPAVADDSGLAVDALGGAPGVYSARYGGAACQTDEDRYRLLLRALEGTEQRTARFVSCIACTFPGGEVLRSRGECEGVILRSPRGDGGFGYDPVFQPAGMEQSMAELSAAEKNRISHRGKALTIFKKELREYHADK